MKRLVFIVEGDVEIIFIEKLVVPHLYSMGFQNPINAQTIITNRKQHKKGGVTSYGLFKNEVMRTLAQGNVIITSLIDLFAIPGDFPGYDYENLNAETIENAIVEDFNNTPEFIPYIQRHEIEALMYSEKSGFELVVDDQKKLSQVFEIIQQYPNPEDINKHPQTAPSKRLEQIFGYDKASDADLIFEMISIEEIVEKCPRFAMWLQKIVQLLEEDNN